jgi:hypothetical protein
MNSLRPPSYVPVLSLQVNDEKRISDRQDAPVGWGRIRRPELRDSRRRNEWRDPEEQKGQNLIGPGSDFFPISSLQLFS